MKQHAPSAARNRDPILAVLERALPSRGVVLELGAGTGEHATFFAGALPGLTWQPTDIDQASLNSIAAWREEEALPNLLPPAVLDTKADPWPFESAVAIVSINMVHISPWSSTEGLIAGAQRTLEPGGLLFLYGPYRIEGRQTAPSNERFELWLKELDPRYGLRHLNEVKALAAQHELRFESMIDMPANNVSVMFRRND